MTPCAATPLVASPVHPQYSERVNNLYYFNKPKSNLLCLAAPSPSPTINYDQEAVLDTGCSHHTLRADAPTNNREHADLQLCGTPTGDTMVSSEKGLLPLQELPDDARTGHHYDELAYKSLYSIGQFCDAGYQA